MDQLAPIPILNNKKPVPDLIPQDRSIAEMQQEIDLLQQQKTKLQGEVRQQRNRTESLVEENQNLRKSRESIQVQTEQDVELISNKLMKKIDDLKKEKEDLAINCEQGQEQRTNALLRKFTQLNNEIMKLQTKLHLKHEFVKEQLMRKIKDLEAHIQEKQSIMEQLKKDMSELGNTWEIDQDALVNKLLKKIHKLSEEKRDLQKSLQMPETSLDEAEVENENVHSPNSADHLAFTSKHLTSEILNLKRQLLSTK